jgi:hypothetical protein
MSELPYDEGDFITLTGTVGTSGLGYELPTFKKVANLDGRVSEYTCYVESIETVGLDANKSHRRTVTLRKPCGDITEVTTNVLRPNTIMQKNSQGWETYWKFEVLDE